MTTPTDEQHILDKEGTLLSNGDKHLMIGFRRQPEGLEAYYFVLVRGVPLCESNRIGIALAYYRGIE